MKPIDLFPVKADHANSVLKGYLDIPDLPVTHIVTPIGDAVYSVWNVPFWKRFAFIFSGDVNVIVMGKTHPPICVNVGDYSKNFTKAGK